MFLLAHIMHLQNLTEIVRAVFEKIPELKLKNVTDGRTDRRTEIQLKLFLEVCNAQKTFPHFKIRRSATITILPSFGNNSGVKIVKHNRVVNLLPTAPIVILKKASFLQKQVVRFVSYCVVILGSLSNTLFLISSGWVV